MNDKPESVFQHREFLEVVSMSPTLAKEFLGRTDEPVDLGPPADPSRYQEGARVYGFRQLQRVTLPLEDDDASGEYDVVIAVDVASAQRVEGRRDQPIDLGPAKQEWAQGARRLGFRKLQRALGDLQAVLPVWSGGPAEELVSLAIERIAFLEQDRAQRYSAHLALEDGSIPIDIAQVDTSDSAPRNGGAFDQLALAANAALPDADRSRHLQLFLKAVAWRAPHVGWTDLPDGAWKHLLRVAASELTSAYNRNWFLAIAQEQVRVLCAESVDNCPDLGHWLRRGREDACRGEPALFRLKQGNVCGAGDVPEDWTRAYETYVGEAYLAGYEEVSR